MPNYPFWLILIFVAGVSFLLGIAINVLIKERNKIGNQTMNSLEKRITKLNLTWVRTKEAFTAIHAGFGFVIYYRNDRIWLAVLTKETVEWQLDCHKTKPPKIIGFWKSYMKMCTKRMFEVPITKSFLVHVVESAFPEMLTLEE